MANQMSKQEQYAPPPKKLIEFKGFHVHKIDKKKRLITIALPCVEEAMIPGHVSGRLKRKYYVDPEIERKLLMAGFTKATSACGSNGNKIFYVLNY